MFYCRSIASTRTQNDKKKTVFWAAPLDQNNSPSFCFHRRRRRRRHRCQWVEMHMESEWVSRARYRKRNMFDWPDSWYALENIVTIVDVVAVVVHINSDPLACNDATQSTLQKMCEKKQNIGFCCALLHKQEPKTMVKQTLNQTKVYLLWTEQQQQQQQKKAECRRAKECEEKREEAKWNDVEIVVLMVIGCIDFICVLAQYTNRYRIGSAFLVLVRRCWNVIHTMNTYSLSQRSLWLLFYSLALAACRAVSLCVLSHFMLYSSI